MKHQEMTGATDQGQGSENRAGLMCMWEVDLKSWQLTGLGVRRQKNVSEDAHVTGKAMSSPVCTVLLRTGIKQEKKNGAHHGYFDCRSVEEANFQQEIQEFTCIYLVSIKTNCFPENYGFKST